MVLSAEIVILIPIIIIGFVVSVLLIRKWLGEVGEKNKPSEDLLAFLKSTNNRLDVQGKAINERLDNAARYIASVQKSIGEMSEIGRGMKDLQEFLASPKLRGNIGEQILKELLTQQLPKQTFKLQYSFRAGHTVDAVIDTSQGLIPIDSKFPLENFRKLIASRDEAERKTIQKEFSSDIKKHIDDIAKKYILTEEGTIDYALMYLPSEAVYYEVVNNPSLFDYATQKRVIPVSPMTFYAYLKAILMSFEGQRIEKEARAIVQLIRAIGKDYEKVEEQLSVLSRHVTNAYNQMAHVVSGFTVLGQKLSKTQQIPEKETKQLEID